MWSVSSSLLILRTGLCWQRAAVSMPTAAADALRRWRGGGGGSPRIHLRPLEVPTTRPAPFPVVFPVQKAGKLPARKVWGNNISRCIWVNH